MKLMALAVTVQIVGGAQPEVKLMPSGYMPVAECEQYAAKMNRLGPSDVRYDDRGRIIIQQYEHCMLVDGDEFMQAIEEYE